MSEAALPAEPTVGFKDHLRAEVVAGDAVYLFSESGVTALQGAQIEALAPLLDGSRSLPTLLGAGPLGLAPEQVGGVLARLEEAGLIALRPAAVPPDDAAGTARRTLAYWDASGLDAPTAVARLANSRIRLVVLDGVDSEWSRSTLRENGLTVVESDEDVDLTIVLCSDYLDPALIEIDAEHRARNREWLLVKPVGAQIWIGPVFTPSEHACWHCLASRLRGHREAEAHVQASLGLAGPVERPIQAIAPLTSMALNLAALEASKWLAGYRYPGQRAVWTLDSLDLRGQRHEIRRRVQCPSCGDPTYMRDQAWRPVALGPRAKTSRGSGGHRAMEPAQVLDAYRHLVSQVTGVVKEIRRDRSGPDFFHVFRSGPNLALRPRGITQLRAGLRAESGGKGTTELQAEVGALCEAIERRSGSWHGDEERLRGSLKSLGEQAIHPNACQLYDDRQYPGRAAWNTEHGPFQFVCDPFDERAVLDWTPVWSLSRQCHRLLPTRMLYYGVPQGNGPCYAWADSNGSAAGTSLEDAALQGLLELVERDAVALWWYNRTLQPAVDLDAFHDPWIDELREVYAGLDREVWVLDLTADLGIPVMVALCRRRGEPGRQILFGLGAHLDPRLALLRALTELNQLMPKALLDERGGTAWSDPDGVRWWRHATVHNQPYLLPDPAQRTRGPGDYAYTPTADLYEDVRVVQNRLEAQGLEVLLLDQTRPDFGLPVVKAIVPGLRGMWARLAPGRLFDVPVRLGRLAVARAYDELNPIPLFL